MTCSLLAAVAGCGPRPAWVDPGGTQAYYRTGAPLHDTSGELEEVVRSLKRINFAAEYVTYLFAEGAEVWEADLDDPEVLQRATERFTENETKSGTAVTLARTGRRVALLTNDHVVRFPERIVRFFDETEARLPRDARHVASVSMRTQTRGMLAEHPHLGPFAVVARDSANDIALLEVQLREESGIERFPLIPVPSGEPRRLRWGAFVYVVGYPLGLPMVTSAIISDPNRGRDGDFLTDGLWNEGISGGPILAVRSESGRLEWVGMTRATAGSYGSRLRPRSDAVPDDPELSVLYDGPVYLESEIRIQYGITYAVSMERVRRFLSEHQQLLRRRGYDLRRY